MTELWAPVRGWPAYEVSNLGRVRSVDRLVADGHGGACEISGRILRPSCNQHGYPVVTFRGGKKVHVTARVHRLVAEAFVPNPGTKPHVNHIDCDRKNARASNLEWCTQAENIKHSASLGRMRFGNRRATRSPSALLTDEQVRNLRQRYAKGGVSLATVGREFGVSKRCAGRAINRETYQDVY